MIITNRSGFEPWGRLVEAFEPWDEKKFKIIKKVLAF